MLETETERLILRKWRPSDSADLYEYARLDSVGPRAGWAPHASEEESLQVIQMFLRDDDVLAVELRTEAKVIGSVGLHARCPAPSPAALKQREIGYVLNPAYWGQGYIPEAVTALLELGFGAMNLDLIWCGHFEDNLKSKRVNEKCGFSFRFKEDRVLTRLQNKKVVVWYYSITKEEYYSPEAEDKFSC